MSSKIWLWMAVAAAVWVNAYRCEDERYHILNISDRYSNGLRPVQSDWRNKVTSFLINYRHEMSCNFICRGWIKYQICYCWPWYKHWLHSVVGFLWRKWWDESNLQSSRLLQSKQENRNSRRWVNDRLLWYIPKKWKLAKLFHELWPDCQEAHLILLGEKEQETRDLAQNQL